MANKARPVLLTALLSGAALVGYISFRLFVGPDPDSPGPQTLQFGEDPAASDEHDDSPAPLADTLPEFSLETLGGEQQSIGSWPGKPLLINFWATWCGPCRSEMPDLQKALGEVGDSVVVLGVNKAQELKEIAPFADELRISFPLIANQAGDIAGRYGAQNLPTSYFISSDGTIGLKKTGVMNYTFIKAHIDLLK